MAYPYGAAFVRKTPGTTSDQPGPAGLSDSAFDSHATRPTASRQPAASERRLRDMAGPPLQGLEELDHGRALLVGEMVAISVPGVRPAGLRRVVDLPRLVRVQLAGRRLLQFRVLPAHPHSVIVGFAGTVRPRVELRPGVGL